MIVANKSDLPAGKRQVRIEDGKSLADELRCGFIEASARNNENVDKAFEDIAIQIDESLEFEPQQSDNTSRSDHGDDIVQRPHESLYQALASCASNVWYSTPICLSLWLSKPRGVSNQTRHALRDGSTF